jgi:hypothetical protein
MDCRTNKEINKANLDLWKDQQNWKNLVKLTI